MINLTGVVGVDITLSNLIKAINKGEKQAAITTYGGDLYEGKAIRDYLKSTGAIETLGCFGIVASAGTIIMQGVKDVWATPATKFLIHNPQGGASGDADALIKTADELRKEEIELINSYVNISGQSFEFIQSLMKEERTITADEALNLKLINRIVNFENMINNEEQKAMMGKLESLYVKFKNLLKISNLVVIAVDGTELDFGAEISDISEVAVGTPCNVVDGAYILADGTTITIVGGVVTSIENISSNDELANALAEIENLKSELEMLKNEKALIENKLNEQSKEVVKAVTEFSNFRKQFSNHSPVVQSTPATEIKKEAKFSFKKK